MRSMEADERGKENERVTERERKRRRKRVKVLTFSISLVGSKIGRNSEWAGQSTDRKGKSYLVRIKVQL